jgi:hypothetical protein
MLPRGLQVIARLDGNSNAVAADGRPRRRVAASMLGDQFPQILQSAICEGGPAFLVDQSRRPRDSRLRASVECKGPRNS